MKKVVLINILFTALCFVPTTGHSKTEPVKGMFVQSAKSVVFEGDQLILKGVAPWLVFFSDRPERIAGQVSIKEFLKDWGEGKDSFTADPPNATLSIYDKDQVQYVVVELSDPKLKGKDLSYKVKVLQGDPPKKGGVSSLFIDWWYGPYGGACSRDWYTGRVWCHRPPYGPPYGAPGYGPRWRWGVW